MYDLQASQVSCRSARVPVCENGESSMNRSRIEADAVFYIGLRDILDYTLDLTAWLGANGNAKITNAVWTVAGDSPKTPIIVNQAHSEYKTVVVLQPQTAPAAVKGDAYWLDVEITIGETTPLNVGDVVIPERTLTRRVHVVVVMG